MVDVTVANTINLSGTITPPPKVTLSAPTTAGAISDVSVQSPLRPLLMRGGPILRLLMLIRHELVPITPRYVIIPCFTL